MILTVISVVFALLLLLFLVYTIRGRFFTDGSLDIAQAVRSVDIEAFRNLVDPDEDEFLRSRLSHQEFRRLRRERLLAAVVYVRAVSANAIILQRLAGTGRRSADPEISRAAQELAENAARLRLNCLQVLIKLWTAVLLPDVNLSHSAFLDRYDRLAGSAARLRRLQAGRPVSHLPVSA